MTDFSYQLYCVRNFPPLSDTLKMVAAAGYKPSKATARSTPTRPRSPSSTSNLAASGLKMPTGHFGLDMLEKEPDRVLEIAKAVGIETIYCPFLLPDQRPDTRRRLARLRPAPAGGRQAAIATPASASAGTTTTSSSRSSPTARCRRSRSSRAAPTSNGRPTSPG